MSLPVSRVVWRQTSSQFRRTAGRHASTTSEAAQAVSSGASKAKESAASVTSKASQGLSRVTSSAGPAISSAARGLGKSLSRIGGRTGRLVAFVESMIPPTVYYSRVGLELSKLIFQNRQMYPPTAATFQSYFQPLLNAAKNPTSLFAWTASQPTNLISRARSMTSQQWTSAAIITAEVIGFFSVGEMIGRMKLVGYRGDTGGHH